MSDTVVRIDESGNYWLYCPGCRELHQISTAWDFDGNLQRPTFSPSILVEPGRCHSFVRNGQWQFLDDCEHDLAGQTVDMMPVDTNKLREEL